MSVMDCYDPEGEFERVVEAAASSIIETFTSQTYPTLQKARSRIEIVSMLGIGRHWVDIDGVPEDRRREDGWDIRAQVLLITEADPKEHSHVRALVRKFMFELPWTLNGGGPGQMLNYVLRGPVRHMSTSPNYKQPRGYYATQMNFQLGISVQQLAWAKLNQDDAP